MQRADGGWPTIGDVARRAGVSVTTVSYVLNDRPGISEPTRERVRAAIAELHYSPNALIRSLQRRRSNLIGLYFWPMGRNPANLISASLLQGINEALAETDYDLLLYSHRAGRFDNAQVTSFLDRRVDGLLWTPAPIVRGALDELAAAKLPTVALLQNPVPDGIGQVRVDNLTGGLEVTRHLIALGHRRIAFSGGLHLTDFRERLAGYRRALALADLAGGSDLEIIHPADWSGDAGEVLHSARAARATAVVCATDAHALTLLRRAPREGIRIPEDLSVAGFDDVPAAVLSTPSLTTAHLPALEVGRTAVRTLLQLLAGTPWSDCRTCLPVELCPRRSTGPPC